MNKFLIGILLLVISLSTLAQTDQPPIPKAGEVLMKFWITDWDEIPEADARVVVNSSSMTFNAEGNSDIDGHFNLLAPNGDTYDIAVYKFDTVFHFNGIETPKEDLAGYEFEMHLKIKVVTNEYVSINNLAVYFKTNDYSLDSEDTKAIDLVLTKLKENPTMKIEIAAHTDDVGDNKSNLRLSQQRANAVKNYLLKKGISANRIVSKGYGEEKPIASNDTEEGKAKNRRVECRVIQE